VEKYWRADAHAKIWRCAEKYWLAGARAKFSIAWCGLSDACVILARGVHTHSKVCVVYTHLIMACVVCAVLAERRGILLVRAQCGFMWSRDNLVNGACRVMVRSGGVLKFGMVQWID